MPPMYSSMKYDLCASGPEVVIIADRSTVVDLSLQMQVEEILSSSEFLLFPRHAQGVDN